MVCRCGSDAEGTPTAVIGASTGLFGAVWAQAELRKVLRTAGADVIEDELPIGQAHEAFNFAGDLDNPDQMRRLTGVIHHLIDGAQTSATQVLDAADCAELRVA